MEHLRSQDFFSIAVNLQNAPGFQQCNDIPVITLQTIHKLDKKVIQQIAAGLGLTFMNPNEATGEVCYAHEPGLRPEFRQSFTATDLLDYIYAVLQTQAEQNGGILKTGVAEIPYPTNADVFWQLVQAGGRLR